MFGTEIRPGRDVCVWPQSISLFSPVWERECFLFIGGRAETLQEMAFLGKTTY